MTEHMRKDVEALIKVLREACKDYELNVSCSALVHVLIEVALSARVPEPKEVFIENVSDAFDFVKQQIDGKKH